MSITLRIAAASLATIVAATAATSAARAEEGGEITTFTRISGGAVYDFRYSVDGSDVNDEYFLEHVVCTDGSKSLRVMLPVSPEDDGMVVDSSGPESTLVKKGNGYEVTFRANGRNIRKTLEVKPVNDPKSNLQEQFVVRVDYGDPLWAALTSSKENAAVMLVGQGGLPVSLTLDEKLRAALQSCGLKG